MSLPQLTNPVYLKNKWFTEEFDEELMKPVFKFPTRQKFEEFQSYLKQELDTIPYTPFEQEYYRHNIKEFIPDHVHNPPEFPFFTAVKQNAYLDAIQDMKNKKIILLTGRGGSKTMLSALISVWSCISYDKYWQTALGGSFDQSKALSDQAKIFVFNNPRLAARLARQPSVTEIEFDNASKLVSLKASEQSARSPHPSGLMLDEVVVMRPDIIKAARGQLVETGLKCYRHGRLIMTSTAQQGASVAFFEKTFRGGWEVFKYPESPKKNWNKFLSFNWSLEDCTWRSDEEMQDIADSRLSMSEEEYNTEVLGFFGTTTGSILNPPDIEFISVNAKYPKYEYRSPEYPCYMGIDWGFAINPTVIVVVQKQSDGITRVLEEHSAKKTDHDYWLDLVEELVYKYNVVNINADANAIGENLRLQKRGLPISAISFGGKTQYTYAGSMKTDTFKNIMLENLQYLTQKRVIEVHPQFQDLLQEMLDYRWQEQKDSPQRKPIKVGVDHVEALQLALLQLRENAHVNIPMSSVSGVSVFSGGRQSNINNYMQGIRTNQKIVTGSVIGGKTYNKRYY